MVTGVGAKYSLTGAIFALTLDAGVATDATRDMAGTVLLSSVNTAGFGRIQSHPRSSLLWGNGRSRAQRFKPRWGHGRSRAQRYSPRWGNGRNRAQWERKVLCVTLDDSSRDIDTL